MGVVCVAFPSNGAQGGTGSTETSSSRLCAWTLLLLSWNAGLEAQHGGQWCDNDLPNGVGIAALFDGHGGEEVSGYLSKHFATGLGGDEPDMSDAGLKKHYMDVDASIWSPEGAAEIPGCINGPKSRPATHRMKLLQMKNANPDLPHAAVEGRLITETCGATAVACLFCGDSELVVANTGGSRCIISSGGVVKELSSDYSLKDAAEVARVH